MKKLIAFCLLVLPTFNCLAQNFTKMMECVIDNGQLKQVVVDYNKQNAEKTIMVNGVRKKIGEVYPAKNYAADQKWYINNEPVTFKNLPYTKYGLPRVLGISEIEKTGMYNGIGVYTEAGSKGLAEIIYIPVRQGCEFQPYQLECTKAYIEEAGNSASAMNFIIKINGETEKINYNWESQLPIIKGQGTNSITVDIKNKNEGDDFDFFVIATSSKKCWLATGIFLVKKPVIKNTKPSAGSFSKKYPVASVQWGARAKRFADGYWDMVAPQLQKIFPKKLADSIVQNAQSMYIPGAFENSISKDGIKMYHVATFDNNYGGKFRGVNYIIWVPYEENRIYWKNSRKPNDFFLVFPKDAVVLQN